MSLNFTTEISSFISFISLFPGFSYLRTSFQLPPIQPGATHYLLACLAIVVSRPLPKVVVLWPQQTGSSAKMTRGLSAWGSHIWQQRRKPNPEPHNRQHEEEGPPNTPQKTDILLTSKSFEPVTQRSLQQGSCTSNRIERCYCWFCPLTVANIDCWNQTLSLRHKSSQEKKEASGRPRSLLHWESLRWYFGCRSVAVMESFRRDTHRYLFIFGRTFWTFEGGTAIQLTLRKYGTHGKATEHQV